jgi:hypothetical protein
VIAGDITPATNHAVGFQRRWLDTTFRAWLADVPAPHIVAIAGNHDFIFERAPDAVPELRGPICRTRASSALACASGARRGRRGSSTGRFNAPKTDPDEAFLEARAATAPADCDMLVVHGPPAGYGDLTARGQAVGSQAFLRLIDAVSPKLAVFGHIHEGRGRWQRGTTQLANASAVDLDYQLVDDPVMTLELER